MTHCLLCKELINKKDVIKAEFYGYFYNYVHYLPTRINTFICLKCHNAWYYENKPLIK